MQKQTQNQFCGDRCPWMLFLKLNITRKFHNLPQTDFFFFQLPYLISFHKRDLCVFHFPSTGQSYTTLCSQVLSPLSTCSWSRAHASPLSQRTTSPRPWIWPSLKVMWRWCASCWTTVSTLILCFFVHCSHSFWFFTHKFWETNQLLLYIFLYESLMVLSKSINIVNNYEIW